MKAVGLAALLAVLALGSAPADAASPGQTVVVNSSAAMRERPGAAYRVTSRASAGSRVQVVRVKDGWVKVKSDSGSGWLPAGAISAAGAAPREREAPRARPRPAPRRAPARVVRERAPRIVEEPMDSASARFVDPPVAPRQQPRTLLPPPSPTGDEVGMAASALAAGVDDEPAPIEAQPEAAAPSPLAVKPPKVKAKTDIPLGTHVAYAAELTPILQEPEAKARPVAIAREGAPLKVVQRTPDGSWLLVEGETPQDRGWVSATVVREHDPTDPATKGIRIVLDGGLGLVTMTQAFASRSQEFLGNFELKSAAAAVAVGSLARYRFAGSTEIGGDFAYRFVASSPGIRVVNGNNETEDLGVFQHVLDVGARIGTRGKGAHGAAVFGRAGYHLDSTSIDTSQNAKLPSDSIKGPTFGGGIDVPGVTENMGFAARFDLLYPATREQTQGLREGTESATYGLLGQAGLHYRINPSWSAGGTYQFFHTKTSFKGQSERLPGTSQAERANTSHMFIIGFGYAL